MCQNGQGAIKYAYALGTINDEKEIEKIILDKIKPHTDFYADDIADEFGLDLWATINVLKSLEERGVVNG